MNRVRYSVRIGEEHCIGANISYPTLLVRLMEYTLRAAIARSLDESDWEQERLRRDGLKAVQIFRNGKAIWDDTQIFVEELSEARRENITRVFRSRNELDPAFYERLDTDLRTRWLHLGYKTPTLRNDMKPLFYELEQDATDRAVHARKLLLADCIRLVQEMR